MAMLQIYDLSTTDESKIQKSVLRKHSYGGDSQNSESVRELEHCRRGREKYFLNTQKNIPANTLPLVEPRNLVTQGLRGNGLPRNLYYTYVLLAVTNLKKRDE